MAVKLATMVAKTKAKATKKAAKKAAKSGGTMASKTLSKARPKVAKKAATARRPGSAPSDTVAAILGLGGNGPSMRNVSSVKPEWRKFYVNLIELRERLVEQMGGLAKESAEQLDGYSLHMADCGTDNFDRDFALSLLSSDQDALYEIDEALKRIMRGSYGVCELTGKPIPKARLEAIPWTRFTVQAQAQLERDGALRQRRLANLGSIEGGSGLEAVDENFSDDARSGKDKD
jgi:RNA polymerase-binding transcription factor DksA